MLWFENFCSAIENQSSGSSRQNLAILSILCDFTCCYSIPDGDILLEIPLLSPVALSKRLNRDCISCHYFES